MADFAEQKPQLDAADISVFAASVDPADKTAEVAAPLNFTVCHSVTRAHAEALGAFWEDRRGIIQPTEFVLRGDGRVLNSTYSAGPAGRLEARDALSVIAFVEAILKRKAEGR